MSTLSSPMFEIPKQVTDRRADLRPTMVLRMGLLESEGKASFCLLRNISANGVQVKLYTPAREGGAVSLRVGDEDRAEGRFAWVRNGHAGIEFKDALDHNMLLRIKQMAASELRRASPRATATEFAIPRTGGHEYPATLCDISTSGAKIRTGRAIEPVRTAMLLLPRLPALRAFVRWTTGQAAGVTFEAPMPIEVITNWLSDQRLVTGS